MFKDFDAFHFLLTWEFSPNLCTYFQSRQNVDSYKSYFLDISLEAIFSIVYLVCIEIMFKSFIYKIADFPFVYPVQIT